MDAKMIIFKEFEIFMFPNESRHIIRSSKIKKKGTLIRSLALRFQPSPIVYGDVTLCTTGKRIVPHRFDKIFAFTIDILLALVGRGAALALIAVEGCCAPVQQAIHSSASRVIAGRRSRRAALSSFACETICSANFAY